MATHPTLSAPTDCTECAGDGYLDGPYLYRDALDCERVHCERCDGSGEISAEDLAAWAEHQAEMAEDAAIDLGTVAA